MSIRFVAQWDNEDAEDFVDTAFRISRAMERVPIGILLQGASIITRQVADNFDNVSSLVDPLARTTIKTRQKRSRRYGLNPVDSMETPLRQFKDTIKTAATALWPAPGSAFEMVNGPVMKGIQFGIGDTAPGIRDPWRQADRPDDFMHAALAGRAEVLENGIEAAMLEADTYIQNAVDNYVDTVALRQSKTRASLRDIASRVSAWE